MATATKKREQAKVLPAAFEDPIPPSRNQRDFHDELLDAVEQPGKWMRLSGSGYPVTKKAQEVVESLIERKRRIPNPNDEWEFTVGVNQETKRRHVYARYIGEAEADTADAA